MPAPEPPKSDVGMESAKNTKIIRTKHYSHHKHTRHVTEDEKIYETVTTTSRPVKISKTVYTTTKVESGPAKTHQRYFESKVHLVNSEDKSAREMPSNQSVISENRKEAKEVHIHHENGHIKVHGKAHNNESKPDSKRDHKPDHKLDHKPESKKDHKPDHKPDHSHENKHEHNHEHKQDLQTPNQALHGSNGNEKKGWRKLFKVFKRNK
ncbi:hypothetical protein M3Y97_00867800 [Aphelenchoides bicaudatus]|nr:hypothetical protein M3Y97_00867800 [Aphelenchoides bicaudatus]